MTPLRIIIIDKDELDRLAVVRSLQKSNVEFRITESNSCHTALHILMDRPYDCILIDINSTGTSCKDFLAELKMRGLQVPVIVFTDKDYDAIAVELTNMGASDSIPKGALSTNSLTRAIVNSIRIANAEAHLHDLQIAMIKREGEVEFLKEKIKALETEEVQRRSLIASQAVVPETIETSFAPLKIQVDLSKVKLLDQKVFTHFLHDDLGGSVETLSEMVEIFIQTWPDRIQKLESYIQEKRFEKAELLIGKIKGKAQKLGAFRLAFLLEVLEEYETLYGEDGEFDEIFAELKSVFKQVRTAILQTLNSLEVA